MVSLITYIALVFEFSRGSQSAGGGRGGGGGGDGGNNRLFTDGFGYVASIAITGRISDIFLVREKLSCLGFFSYEKEANVRRIT